MANPTHELKLKVGDIDITADVYKSDSGNFYCKIEQEYLLPERFSTDLKEILERLSNLSIGLGDLDHFKMTEVE